LEKSFIVGGEKGDEELQKTWEMNSNLLMM